MINNSIKAIAFGSNFGFNVHYYCLKKFFKFQEIAICSPNILKKKINASKKFEKFNIALKNNFDFISISTPPSIQYKICNCILKKNKKPKFLILEKPVAENFNFTKKILQNLKKKKIRYLVNFIFINIKEFEAFKKLISKNEIIDFNYVWNFTQAYFLNKKKTWKILEKNGGGLINYYLIHVFYNLLFFFKKIEIKDVQLSMQKKIITKCDIFLKIENSFILKISMNINAKKNLHYLNFKTKNSFFELSNKTKDWVNGFKVYKNKKKINLNSKKIDRSILTFKNYLKIKNKRDRKNNNLLSERAHEYCYKVLNFKT